MRQQWFSVNDQLFTGIFVHQAKGVFLDEILLAISRSSKQSARTHGFQFTDYLRIPFTMYLTINKAVSKTILIA